ncbi:MAG: AAA family ATPase [Methanospirillum sp.]|nr:AAA family ATPase [Methanospirillum sp.]
MKIALSGKGGVGKTTIAALLAAGLARRGYATLAIDADPAPNLGPALGLPAAEAERIVPIAEDADLVAMKTDTGYAGVYNLSFPVDDLIRERAVMTPSGAGLLVMGTVRAAGGGCTCPAAAVVRALLRRLVVGEHQAVVLDLEAGLEHLGRGTAAGVDLLLVLVDGSAASCAIAGRIRDLARELGIPRTALVGSRLSGDEGVAAATDCADRLGMPLIGVVPDDPGVAGAGRAGGPVPADGPTAALADDLLELILAEAA